MNKQPKKTDIATQSLLLHKKLGGKLRIEPAFKVKGRAELSLVYTPGVAAVSTHLAKHPKDARIYTGVGRTVAVVSDGSAVLGLGNIGPFGALPVMEGKAMIFKSFGGVDAVPIVLSTQDSDEIVRTVMAIAPSFGGINLEDISAPRCFDIEKRLVESLSIPVMHDDQHGTAIVVLAALYNALKVVKKDIKKINIVVSGAGAAGTAVATLLRQAGAGHIVVLDSKGVIHVMRGDLTPHKEMLAKMNVRNITGTLQDALREADVLIGVSGPGLATSDDIRLMNKDAIVFALANPTPEIMPEEAKKGGAKVIGTGRSDYPNQINNSLAFPGIFRGALDHKVTKITEAMKLKAAKAIASLVPKPTANKIVPDMFDKRVAVAVAKVIR